MVESNGQEPYNFFGTEKNTYITLNHVKDSVFDFLDSNILIAPESKVSKYNIYKEYLKSNGDCTPTEFWKKFNKWKESKGYIIGELQSKERYKKGIELLDRNSEWFNNIFK